MSVTNRDSIDSMSQTDTNMSSVDCSSTRPPGRGGADAIIDFPSDVILELETVYAVPRGEVGVLGSSGPSMIGQVGPVLQRKELQALLERYCTRSRYMVSFLFCSLSPCPRTTSLHITNFACALRRRRWLALVYY